MSFLKSINPYTGRLLAEYPVDSPEMISEKLDELDRSYEKWKDTSYRERSEYLLQLADSLEMNKKELGKTASMEMGKCYREAISEIEKSAWVCRHYAEHGEDYLGGRRIPSDGHENRILYQPLGIILAIMPWNFPYWQVFRCFAPNIMAGNLFALKHASNVQGSAFAIEKLVNTDVVFLKNICIAGKDTEPVIRDRRVKGVTLTGSEKAGASAASAASASLKKSVLELGGSDPFIVHDDANIDDAVNAAFTSRMINNGQSCIAAKRFIVHDKRYESFIETLQNKLCSVKMGDPLDDCTTLGPLVHEDAACELMTVVEESLERGAKLIGKLEKNGAFLAPVILTDIHSGCPAYHRELFGPVFSVYRYREKEEAVTLANDTVYGLSASLWTASSDIANYFSEALQAGAVFINDFSKSDPRLPFGGIKQSGYGRELSREGILEFVNVKLVSLKESSVK